MTEYKFKVSFTSKYGYVISVKGLNNLTKSQRKIFDLIEPFDGKELTVKEIFENIMPFCDVIFSKDQMTCEVYNDWRE